MRYRAQLALPGPDREPGQQPEAGTMNAPYTAKKPNGPKSDGAVPQGVHAHREERARAAAARSRRMRWRSAASAAMPKPMPVSTVKSGCANGDMTTRTKKVAAVTEARPEVADLLVLAEGGAEVEDVLGEGETGRGEAGTTTPSTIPVKSRLRKMKSSRIAAALALSSTTGAMTVAPELSALAGSAVGGGYPAGREGVRDDRDEGGGEGAPGEGEEQIPPGSRLDPVQPAEGRDEQRHGQDGEAQADQEALGAGLFAYQREDDQAGEGEQGDQHPVPAPPCCCQSQEARRGLYRQRARSGTASKRRLLVERPGPPDAVSGAAGRLGHLMTLTRRH